MPLPLTTITFPEIRLAPRDAHKLRGYFGTVFQERSPLLHNHYADGALRYKYPLVQYKVVGGVPTLVAIGEGAQLLTGLFLEVKELNIDGKHFPVYNKNIVGKQVEIGVDGALHRYCFESRWMALNQENYRQYIGAATDQRKTMLNRILVGNMLSFFKGVNILLKPEERIMADLRFTPKEVQFKDQKMIAFEGEFTANVMLPDLIGLGKSVSRGFGCIRKIA